MIYTCMGETIITRFIVLVLVLVIVLEKA